MLINHRPFLRTISRDSHAPFSLRIDGDNVTGDRYSQQVILLHVHLFGDTIGADFIFMYSNTR